MKYSYIYIFISLLFLTFSCVNSEEKTETEIENKPKEAVAGETTEMFTLADSSQSYQIYLPENYSDKYKFPIIIAFDPQGKGFIPVQLLKNSAQKYGYILVGSNSVRNGLTTLNYSINTLLKEILDRYSVDNQRIYTAGFSGGAKVASSIALYKEGVAGVIACGSGFDKINQQITSRFDLISIVGLEDFNYQEVKKLHYSLSEFGFNQEIIVFDGTHTWPSTKELDKAVDWLEIMAMKRKLKPIDDALVRTISESWAKEVNQLMATNESYQAYRVYDAFLQTFSGIYSINEYQANFDQLAESKEIKNALLAEKDIAAKEILTQQMYFNAFSKKTQDWWENEINKLHRSTADRNMNQMNKRLLAFNSMMAYVHTNTYLDSRNMKAAARFLKLYRMIDPENSDIDYLQACYFSIQNKPKEAANSLSKAFRNGFNDYYLIENDLKLKNWRASEFFQITF